MKAQVTIDIPDGWELAEPEVRVPRPGEWWLWNRDAMRVCKDDVLCNRYPILRRSWTWPEWLKAGWIAMDANGEWWAFTEEPVVDTCDTYWDEYDSDVCNLSNACLDFTPPPCDDWRQSKRRNPNL